MAKHLFVVLTNCVEGGDESEFNDWYDHSHVPDLLSLPGFEKATRYRLASAQVVPPDQLTHNYLTVYEIETDDLEATLRGLPANAEDVDAMGWRISPNIDVAGTKSWIYTPLADG